VGERFGSASVIVGLYRPARPVFGPATLCPARTPCPAAVAADHSRLFDAKLILSEATAARMLRAMEIASCTLEIAPITLKPGVAMSLPAVAMLYPIFKFSLPHMPSVLNFESY
jgi:hypothetical protein